jgi:hypothetical protein
VEVDQQQKQSRAGVYTDKYTCLESSGTLYGGHMLATRRFGVLELPGSVRARQTRAAEHAVSIKFGESQGDCCVSFGL